MTAFALLSVLVVASVRWTGTDAQLLPNDSKPISYELHVEPDIEKSHLEGSVTIDFIMMVTSTIVTLNQKDLVIDTIEIEGVPLQKFYTDHNLELLVIYSEFDLVPNRTYSLTVEYNTAIPVDTKEGLYKTRYTIGNETKWLATTNLEPTFARLAFPCWDEPMYKAVFDISITHTSNYTTVFSNMPIHNNTVNEDDTITTYFKRTVPMPTYLVAFTISNYAYKSHDDNRFKIYTKPDSVNKTEFAYNFSIEAMNVLDEYTEIPYFQMIPKMDQMTIIDRNPGAMENWGSITYSEEYLLYENGTSTTTDKDNILSSIAHEFCHQWFGNLVTPKWWNYLWLSEGLCEYLQYYVIHKVNPTWRYMEYFPVRAMQDEAFNSDTREANSMNRDVTQPDEISNLFDDISYQKSACITRALSHVLTEEVFHTALKSYLRERSYSSVIPTDLVRHFQIAAGLDKTWGGVPLIVIINNWIKQSGYPMVSVEKISPGNYVLSQKQFLFYESDDLKRWWIPISYATVHNLNFADTSVTHWMNPRFNNLTIIEPETDWILLNKIQTGYYRVNYDEEIWQKLTEYLKSSNMHRIHPVNRAQLLDDALTMARINHTKYETALSLTLYLYREIDPIPWISTFNNLDFLRHKIFPSRHYDIFKHYIRYIMHSVTKNVTYVTSSKDDHLTKLMKGTAMKWACLADVKECVDEAHKQFNAWLKDPNYRLDPDLKNTIICTGLRTVSEAVWNEVRNRLSAEVIDRRRETSPLEVLGCSNNRTILNKFLMYSAQPHARIRFTNAVKGVLANTNVTGIEIVQDVLDTQYKTLRRTIFPLSTQIESIMEPMAKSVTTNEEFLKLSKFAVLRRISDNSINRVVKESLRNMEWLTKYGPIFDEWLLEHDELFKSSATKNTLMPLLLIGSIINTLLFRMFL